MDQTIRSGNWLERARDALRTTRCFDGLEPCTRETVQGINLSFEVPGTTVSACEDR
jgi:hypothetical protein